MTLGCGIVLQKLFAQRYAISVFDRHEGKKIAVPSTENICLGSLIEYQVTEKRHAWHLHAIQTLALPRATDTQELLFVHHVLEICSHFLPINAAAQDIFDLLINLYQPCPLLAHDEGRFVFVAKLLMALGIYPHVKALNPLCAHILRTPIDNLSAEPIHLDSKQELCAWIFASLAGHPCITQLKTLSFLPESVRI